MVDDKARLSSRFDRGLLNGVQVVTGDKDFVHPGDDLAAAFPDGRCETLRGVDHFATTESFGFFDAALEFLDAI